MNRFKFFTILILPVLLFCPMVKAEVLSAKEKQISHYIIQKHQEQLLLLKKLVNINSGTTNFTGIRQVGDILRPEFAELGFKTGWIKEPVNMRRMGTLLAEKRGTQGKRLLLIGHLDTVFPPNSPFQQFKYEKHIATGPGIIDDKGGDVVILYALKALKAAHALDNVNITVALVGDEEDSGKPISIARKPLIEAAQHSDIALDFEWAITRHTATIARRGITHWTLQTRGNEAHSSEIFQPSVGDSAIFEMSRILNAMRAQLSGEKYLSLSPGIILGGTRFSYDKNLSQGTAFGKENVVSKIAFAQGDLRFLNPSQKNHAEKIISNIVNQHLTSTTATMTFEDAIPSMLPTPANSKLLQKYSQASIDLGYGAVKPLDPGLRGAADISHIAAIVNANLAGLGPVGTGAHSEKETLDVGSLIIQTQRAALLIYRLTH